MGKEEELRVCENCGSTNTTVYNQWAGSIFDTAYTVKCKECGHKMKVKQFESPVMDRKLNQNEKMSEDVLKDLDTGITFGTMRDIEEHIRKAAKEAERRHIKANIIIIDQELAHANTSLLPHPYGGYTVLPPMIFGLEVKYQMNLTRDLGVNFILTEGNTTGSELNALRERNRELEEKLEKIKELLGVEDI